MKISKVWDICLRFEYDEKKLTKGLGKFLKRFKDKKILDPACGTGFAILDLIDQGYDITCSDGSAEMLNELKVNAKEKGISISPHLLKWSELSNKFSHQFDVVMCRGSSLIYGSSWDSSRKNGEVVIQNALKNFYACLKSGGTVYVDTTTEENLERVEEYITYKPKKINGVLVGLSDRVTTNKKSGLRTWTPTFTIGAKTYRLKRYSYYLPHEKLIRMMENCGFKNIRKQKVEGEHYQVFIAEK